MISWDSAGRGRIPFSFVYGGQDSTEMLREWHAGPVHKQVDGNRVRRTRSWSDPATGLVVRLETADYPDHEATEWLVHFTNEGSEPTPLLEQVRAVDLCVTGAGAGPVQVHHARGSQSEFSDYAPREDRLCGGDKLILHSHGVKTSLAGAGYCWRTIPQHPAAGLLAGC